jgi:hypothetical protein
LLAAPVPDAKPASTFAGRAPLFSAAGRKTGFHFCWPRPFI